MVRMRRVQLCVIRKRRMSGPFRLTWKNKLHRAREFGPRPSWIYIAAHGDHHVRKRTCEAGGFVKARQDFGVVLVPEARHPAAAAVVCQQPSTAVSATALQIFREHPHEIGGMRQAVRIIIRLVRGSISLSTSQVLVAVVALLVLVQAASLQAAAGPLSADEQTLVKWSPGLLTRAGLVSSGVRPCGWKFVTCSATGDVLSVVLPKSNLTGRMQDLEVGRLTSLQKLDFSFNSLEGPLPEDIANCTMLKELLLPNNRLSGPIPSSLGRLSQVEEIDLSSNLFNGTIPPELGNCSSIKELKLHQNQLTGSLPPELGKLTTLSVITVRANQLTGSLPPELGNLNKLIFLGLSENPFSGPIPATLGKLSQLITLSMHHTSLSGEIPPELGNFKNLIYMLIQQNELTGPIPDLGNCDNLQYLNLSHNHLSGPVPSSLVELKYLSDFDVSYNNLSGPVPVEIAKMPKFVYAGNPGLSVKLPAAIGHRKRLSTGAIVGIAIAAAAVLLSSAICAVAVIARGGRLRRDVRAGSLVRPSQDTDKDSASVVVAVVKPQEDVRENAILKHSAVTFAAGIPNARIVAVAESVTEENVIGVGGCGTVYKAVMPVTGELVAVKKITGSRASDGVREASTQQPPGSDDASAQSSKKHHISLYQSYCNEIKAAGKIRHKNIVKVLGFCWNDDCNCIVYEYISNGSLADALHRDRALVFADSNPPSAPPSRLQFDWPVRFNIALGTAQAIAYFHHDCTPQIIHRDIKSSNILLDGALQPHVTDFGLAKLVVADSAADRAASLSTFTTIVGSYGYIAPEYAYTLKITEKSDIYSYGVVLLELLTGKSPLHACFVDAGLSMVTWMRKTVNAALVGRHLTRLAIDDLLDVVLDPALKSQAYVLEEELDLHRSEMAAVLAISQLCTDDSPAKRPSMRDIESQLEGLRQGNSGTNHLHSHLLHMYTNLLP